ncbi:Solute carrier family 22 member 13 [Holothuria leucospilota]|uniref:Solute carrier family 22 member 13 n=1 Tax=Holothuria leucospilota TaxID=206669 RepID=A0A9Q1BB13_HOLLE|nr:Solute carrier family 22 member 13 [Holothuria leucospilota]
MDFEKVLGIVGKFGRYQKGICLLLSLPMFVGVAAIFIQVFIAGKSDHWCKTTAWENDNCDGMGLSTAECAELKKILSVPVKKETDGEVEYEKCLKYDVDGIDLETAAAMYNGGNGSYTLKTIPCNEGWEFDTTTFPSTIIMEFELVCGKAYLTNIAQSVFFAGYLVGSAVPGLTADMFGRRLTLLVCLVLIPVMSILNVFSPTMWMYIILRFFIAVFVKGCNLACYVMGSEIVSPSKRAVVGNFVFTFFALGYFFLALIAKFITNWRILQLVVALVYLPVIIFSFFFIPESPRWLISKKRLSDAEKLLTKIARINKKEVTGNIMKSLEEIGETDDSAMKGSLKGLIHSRIGMLIVINMSFNWAVQSILYYGLSLSTSTLGIDPYISFMVSGAIEIPAYILCMFVPNWFGRKASTVGTMLLAGISCCLTPALPLGLGRALLAMAGKFFATMSFSLVYVWAAEMIPTSLRSSGIGLFSASSRIGGILVPLLLILDEVWESLPVVLFGVLGIVAGLLCLVLPETKGKPLPSTMEDTENLYR